MREISCIFENTPPRIPDLDPEDEFVEEIDLDDNIPPPGDDEDDDELEMEELTLAELENRLGLQDPYETDDDEIQERARISAIYDNAKFTFRGHGGPVFACSLHPQQPWAATGGEDDLVFIWNTNNCEILHEINQHKDTVTETHFSHDGSYLASGDLAGELFVHKVVENDNERLVLLKVWNYSMGDMSWMRWHHAANVLLAGSDSGEIYIWRLPNGDCKILPGAGVRTETAELTHDGKKLFAAYCNCTFKLWDLKSCTVITEVNETPSSAMTSSAFAVACHREAPIYVCGDSHGKLVLCSNNGAVGTLQAERNVECLAFAPLSELHMLASGTLEGQIAIWDYSKYTLRSLCDNPNLNDGILRLKWLNENTLLVCTQQGNLHAFDARSGALKFTLTGHHYDIYEFAYNVQKNLLLTVSEDTTAKIFSLPMLGD